MILSIGAGIAIAGIWLSIGVTAWKDSGAAVVVAFFAMMTTVMVFGS